MRALLWLLLSFGAANPATLGSGDSDAPSIYSQAMTRILSVRPSPYLKYSSTITITHKSKTKTYKYDVLERTADHTARFTSLEPDGTESQDIRVAKPLVSPAQFLNAVEADDAEAAQPPTIAKVVSSPYRVSLEGIEAAGSCPDAYRLRLDPIGDEKRHALRELWIDRTTYAICQAAELKQVEIITSQPAIVLLQLNQSGYVTRWHLEGTGHVAFMTYSILAEGEFSDIAGLPDADAKLFR